MERSKHLIVTADDLGLSHSINLGIFWAHENAVVTCASLLMNGPATDHAIANIKNYPRLQIGLHLSIVEGFSLIGKPSSVTDQTSYFGGDKLCLRRDWRSFVRAWACFQINPADLEIELEEQFRRFLLVRGEIPFVNSSQHLHLLPGISSMVIRLCEKYGVKWLRTPALRNVGGMKGRWISGTTLSVLGWAMRRKLKSSQVRTADRTPTRNGATVSLPRFPAPPQIRNSK